MSVVLFSLFSFSTTLAGHIAVDHRPWAITERSPRFARSGPSFSETRGARESQLLPVLYTKRFGNDVTSVFRWDSDTVGVLDPTRAEITLISNFENPAAPSLRAIPLAAGQSLLPSGSQIYPDVVEVASDGTIYWLSRAGGAYPPLRIRWLPHSVFLSVLR